MEFRLGIEEVDCLFESRSTPPGGVFLGPPSPLPHSAQGSGFPPGVHASPRGQGASMGPIFTLFFPEARARLSGFHASRLSGPKVFFLRSIFELYSLYKINAAGCFQQRPIIYIMLSSLIFPNISLTTENITPCFSTLSRTIFLFWSGMFVFSRLFFSLW